MEKLVSSWFANKSVPQDYVFPSSRRPGKDHLAPVFNSIPVIDLQNAEGDDRSDIIQQILCGVQDFGFFQVINHGVSERLMDEAMSVFQEFFCMPNEDKAELFSEDSQKSTRLFTSNNYDNEEFHFWRDNLRHPCYPLDEYVHLWPTKPKRYRDVVGPYSVEVRNLLSRILALISEGLGLESSFFGEEFTKIQMLSANHYPPCPDPSLTLGLPKHCDPGLVTAVHQGDIAGLQVFKDGQWIGVEALRNAFVINIGYQLQMITNGKYKCAEHRAVTNSGRARTTIVTFINPDLNCIIEPARALLNSNPPLYRSFQYREFITSYTAKIGDPETVLEPFELKT